MTNINREQGEGKNVAQKKKIQDFVDFFFWPSIVFGPCNFIFLLITWKYPGDEAVQNRICTFFGMILFLAVISASLWLKRHKE